MNLLLRLCLLIVIPILFQPSLNLELPDLKYLRCITAFQMCALLMVFIRFLKQLVLKGIIQHRQAVRHSVSHLLLVHLYISMP